ncbi:MAG: 3-isopropylmalate dehydratase [Armatimonadetes bacterium]|nr:3-isopropylmalate dehydratase [Armatimonadota bacterium]HOC32294.1 3-isopropylmalate dehydratase [Armatimonadota bacterium]
MESIIQGRAYVLGDDIDTDQIIPAEHLVYNPGIPEERKMFGVHALSGVPAEGAGLPNGNVPFGGEEGRIGEYPVIIAGRNFGCGSSREHAPLALAEAGVRVVVAEFYARIFFRNSVNGGYLIPYETKERLIDRVATGDEVIVDVEGNTLTNVTRKEVHILNPLGDVLPIIEAGDVFKYAQSAGMASR